MRHPEYERAARHITEKAVKDTLMEMVDIGSPTGKEGDLAQYIVGRLKNAGCTAYLQDVSENRPNAVGVWRGTGEGFNLLFTGHMDTSYDGNETYLTGEGFKAKAIYRDGWIWGLGANNMKSGLASALVTLEAIARENIKLKGDVLYGGVVGETEKAAIDEFKGAGVSGYGVGSRHLVLHGISADYAVLCEPTNLQLCTANMGAIWAKITVSGTVSHAARSHMPGVVNAIKEMVALERMIEKWAAEYHAGHEYMGEHPNVTVAAVRGGLPWRLARNPTECSLYLDIRTVPGQTLDGVKRSLRTVLRTFADERNRHEPSLEFFVNDPPTAISEDDRITRTMREAYRRVTGKEASNIIRRPGADSTHFNRYDVTCITYGPGGRTHPGAKRALDAEGEHASVENLYIAAQVYLDTALTLCNQPAQ